MIVKAPPMGWNSWNTFGENIHEDLVFETADAIISTGLKDAGYTYLVLDDCWAEHERDTQDRLVPDRRKFPHGMKAVSDYVHARGLKFGMESRRTDRTAVFTEIPKHWTLSFAMSWN